MFVHTQNDIISFQIRDSDKLIPELPNYLVRSGLTNDLLRNAGLFDEMIVAITQMKFKTPFKLCYFKRVCYEREKVRICYSSKEFIPDFTFEDLSGVLEVKFCKTDKKEKELVDEINADIPAYNTKYKNLTFLVYDMGIIRDSDLFVRDIEKNNPRIKVLIIKH